MPIDPSSYQALFDSMHIGVVFQDCHQNVIKANRAAQVLLNLGAEQIDRELFFNMGRGPIHKDGSLFDEESYPSVQAVKSGKAVQDVVMGVYHSENPQPRWLMVNSHPHRRDNEESPLQVCTTFVDITDQITAEKKVARKNQMQDLIVNISKEFIHASIHNVDDVIEKSLEELGKFSKADRLYIFDYDLDHVTTSNTYEWCAPGITSEITNLQNVPLKDIYQWVSTHQNGEYMYVANVARLGKNDPLREILEPQHIQSLITVPIMKQNEAVGFVGMDFVKKLYDPDLLDIDLLTLYSQILNNLYEHIKALKQLSKINADYKERLKELNTIYGVNNIAFKKPSVEKYFNSVVSLIPKGFLHPESTSVKAVYGDQIFLSDNYEKGENKIASEIKINGKSVGRIEVFLKSEDLTFLDEESQLLESIAMDSGIFLESNLNEQKINESERRYRALFDNSPDGYLLIKGSTFIQCNKAAAELIGGSEQYIIGKTPEDISPEYQPDGTESAKFIPEVIEKVMAGERLSFNWVHERKDGREISLEINLNMVKLDNQDVILTTWRDRTAQIESDNKVRKLSQAAEQSPVAVVVTDLKGIIEYVSPAFTEITGWQQEEVIGEHTRLLKSGKTPDKVYKDLWQTIMSGRTWNSEWTNRKKNGDLYDEKVTVTPIVNENGKVESYLAIKEDITSEKKHIKTIEFQNNVLKEMAFTASHTVRAPLTRLIGLADLIRDDEISEQQKEKFLLEILNSADEIDDIIHNVANLLNDMELNLQEKNADS